jgi:hypothetical protein
MSHDVGVRRRLLAAVVVGSVALAAAGAIALVVTEVRPTSPGPEWVHAASVDELRRDGIVYVPLAQAYVVADDSLPIALYARSTHDRNPITYCDSSGWFEDRAHGSRFDRLGRYVLGPAPRGLDRFEVEIVDGQIWVDPSNVFIGPPCGEPTEPPSGPFCPTD